MGEYIQSVSCELWNSLAAEMPLGSGVSHTSRKEMQEFACIKARACLHQDMKGST